MILENGGKLETVEGKWPTFRTQSLLRTNRLMGQMFLDQPTAALTHRYGYILF